VPEAVGAGGERTRARPRTHGRRSRCMSRRDGDQAAAREDIPAWRASLPAELCAHPPKL
jgi:hypothetical protein